MGAIAGEPGVMEKTLRAVAGVDFDGFDRDDVGRALASESPGRRELGALLSPAAEGLLEEIARRAKDETERRFGNSVGLFTPLYLSNFCDNDCAYCGFAAGNGIARGRLSLDEIEREFAAIAETGLKEILLLTGESRAESDVGYIADAVALSKRFFSTTGVEVYPLEVEEYALLNESGADFVNVYQETYDEALYQRCHAGGPKGDFSRRFDAPERALLGGMRGVGLGALLGLGDFRPDVFAAAVHADFLRRKHPCAEISFSVPRLRPSANGARFDLDAIRGGENAVGERRLLQAMLAYRIFMPEASIAISSRERAGFRDNAIGLVANKISAGVKVGVGGHGAEKKGDEQFELSDPRDVRQIHAAILAKGLQPVYVDYLRLTGGAE